MRPARTFMTMLAMSAAGPASAQDSKDQARGVAGHPIAKPQRLVLTEVPVATGKPTTLFDDRSLNGVPVAEVRHLATIAPEGTRRPLTHGHIQLQSEGAGTWFRAITVEPVRTLPKIVVARE